MEDGFRGGLTVEDSLQVAQWLAADGSVDALQLTGGHTTRSPFYLMRGDVPLREMIQVQRHWLRRLGMQVFGCQSASKFDPLSASNCDPLVERRVRVTAVALSEPAEMG